VEPLQINLPALLLEEMVDQEVEIVMPILIELELVTLLHLVHHKEIQVDLQGHLMVLAEVVERQDQELLDLVVMVEQEELVHQIQSMHAEHLFL
jgi:antitoxin component of MazEF toxin-antitoxin module